jgi:uracil-DNA glycosylase
MNTSATQLSEAEVIETPAAKRSRAFAALELGLSLQPRGKLLVRSEPLDLIEPLDPFESLDPVEVFAVTPGTRSLVPNIFTLKSLEELEREVAGCVACGLCKTRTQTVFSAGHSLASLAIVGEAPGAEEDRTGQAFVGPAGKLLDSMLISLGLSRAKDAYICNVLKCRPPNNRDPSPEEVAQCEPFLQAQLNLVQPKIILVVGRFAAQSLLHTEASIASLRGKLHSYAVAGREVPVVVTYHPAYLLRNLADKAKTWADLCFLQAQLARLQAE